MKKIVAVVKPFLVERVLEGLLDLLGAIDRVAGPQAPEQFKPIRDFLDERGRGAKGGRNAKP